MKCETCEFYSPIQSVKLGEEPTWDNFGKCHRYPPHNKNNAIAARAYFPTVAHDDWCGEHVERGDGSDKACAIAVLASSETETMGFCPANVIERGA